MKCVLPDLFLKLSRVQLLALEGIITAFVASAVMGPLLLQVFALGEGNGVGRLGMQWSRCFRYQSLIYTSWSSAWEGYRHLGPVGLVS